MRVAGLNIFKFLAYLREELTIVLGTASSDAVLPRLCISLQQMGVNKSVVGLVIPTGYSFNLDAFSIYLTLAVVFLAQATNTPLSIGDLLLVLAISLVTSKGAHGVPGVGDRDFCGDAQRCAQHPRDWGGAGPFSRLVYWHGASARQLDRELRGHGGCRRLGKRPQSAAC